MKVSVRNGKGSLAHNERKSELIEKEIQNDKHTLGYSHINEKLTKYNKQVFKMSSKEKIDRLAEALQDSFIEWNSHQKNKDRHKPTELEEIKKYIASGMRETIFQIGNVDEHASAEELQNVFITYFHEFIKDKQPNIYIIGATLHLDEATPHIHFDWVPLARDFKLREKQKNVMPLDISNKAFEQMGFVVPKEDKCRTYNPLTEFTRASQEAWDRSVEALGFKIDKSSRGTVQKHLEKAEYVKTTLAAIECELLTQLNGIRAMYENTQDYVDRINDICLAVQERHTLEAQEQSEAFFEHSLKELEDEFGLF